MSKKLAKLAEQAGLSKEEVRLAIRKKIREALPEPRVINGQTIAHSGIREYNKVCVGCGCKLWDRTKGCRRCTKRHSERKKRLREPGWI